MRGVHGVGVSSSPEAQVQQVTAGGQAEQVGVLPGSWVVEVGNGARQLWEVESLDDFSATVMELLGKGASTIVIVTRRGGEGGSFGDGFSSCAPTPSGAGSPGASFALSDSSVDRMFGSLRQNFVSGEPGSPTSTNPHWTEESRSWDASVESERALSVPGAQQEAGPNQGSSGDPPPALPPPPPPPPPPLQGDPSASSQLPLQPSTAQQQPSTSQGPAKSPRGPSVALPPSAPRASSPQPPPTPTPVAGATAAAAAAAAAGAAGAAGGVAAPPTRRGGPLAFVPNAVAFWRRGSNAAAEANALAAGRANVAAFIAALGLGSEVAPSLVLLLFLLRRLVEQ